MAFQLKKKESLSSGLRRILKEELESALEQVSQVRSSPEEAVHELRKHFKRLRAVFRLVRDGLPEEAYARESDFFRNAGRALAPARDALVKVRALEMLAKLDEDPKPPAEAIRPWKKTLSSRYRSAMRRLVQGGAVARLERELKETARREKPLKLTLEGFSSIARSLERTYRQGRRRGRDAYRTRTDSGFHDWRKRAKDLRYHVEILGPMWPGLMKGLEQDLHDLTDRLGDDHDLAELRRTIGRKSQTRGSSEIVDVIDWRRAVLQAEAKPLGERIFLESPSAFVRRLSGYWDVWRSSEG